MTTTQPLDCSGFADQLGGYLEHDLDLPLRAACDAHRRTCARCDALVRELVAITEAAAALPPIDPPPAVWDGISARLTPRAATATPRQPSSPPHPTIPLAVHTPARWHVAPRQLAAAAVLLVVVSVGVTWTIARPNAPNGTSATAPLVSANAGPTADGAPAQVNTDARDASATDAATSRDVAAARGVIDGPPAEGPARDRSADRAPSSVASTPTAPSAAAPASTRAPGVLVARRADAPALAIDSTYAAELTVLRAVADERLAGLDSATVQVVQRNLDIIDTAIAESRAALARDPASRLLLEQLDRAYERKVELLRRLVLL